ncbi:hypothetical protein Rhe02_47840 [Rhizocola hellebori]|uniref:Serine protease n=2 Tax=Rhizocola hellebori TaxID=1392758 RepID=A0A8J3VHX0_9ACTN|nr:hypothetical protein Rhe02_47840 [Rhizocola hellebori]
MPSGAAEFPTMASMNPRYRRHAQAFLGVAILLAGMFAAPAYAAEEPKQDQDSAPSETPPAGFRSWEELTDTQDRLNSAADYILSERSEGFSGLVAAPEKRALQVFWKGEIPADVKQRAAESGVPVEFGSAAYSQAELNDEVTRLGADKRVGEASPNADGSGVTVTVGNDADAEAVRREARLRVSVNVDRSPELLFDRQNDISPYWGGARWSNLSWGTSCSTGFSVIAGGQPRMLSAAHCADGPPAIPVSNVVRIGNATQPNTTVIGDINARDHLLINRPQGRTFAGRIYTGPWNSSTSAKVIGSTPDYVGNWICTGGARSGEHCNIRVVAVNTSVLGIAPLTRAEKVPAGPFVGNCIAAPGDSGGPVYNYGLVIRWPFLQWGAVARGTITAGVLDTPCWTNTGWATGSWRVWYAPVRRPLFDIHIGSLQWYGATLM